MKRATFVILLLLISGITFAGLDFGIKVGYNANKLSANIDSVGSQFKSGFQIGAFLRIGGRFYVQPELYYSLQGAKYLFNNPTNTGQWEQNVTIGSMDIPVLVGFKFLKSETFNIRIFAGPVASFVVNKSIKEEGSITGPLIKSSIKDANWYIQAGAGVDLLFMNLDIRYQFPLNQAISTVVDSNGISWNFNSKNQVWVISLGFKIL
jgi:hypothetical protein